jgi:peptidoglycan/LPS O-acetylase OafA/YrhL
MLAGDPLRALAATMVVGYHALYASALATGGEVARHMSPGDLMGQAYGRIPGAIGSHLNVGVYIFFALTGYFVGGPYVRSVMSGKPAPDVGRYLSRRLRRIVPAFWLFAAISILVMKPADTTFGDLASVFGFVQNWHVSWTRTAIGQAWTLDIEMAFYLALPLAAWLLSAPLRGRAVRPGTILAVIALLGALSLAVTPGYPSVLDSWSMSLPCILWAFTPGLALAALEPVLEPRLSGRRGRLLSVAVLAVGAGAFVTLTQISIARTVSHCFVLTLFAGCVVGAALIWQWSTGGAPRWVTTRAASALGRWSYGIYLCHFVLSIKLVDLAPASASAKANVLLTGPLTFAASVAVAATSWRFLERPILEWRSAARAPSGSDPDVLAPLSPELSTPTA